MTKLGEGSPKFLNEMLESKSPDSVISPASSSLGPTAPGSNAIDSHLIPTSSQSRLPVTRKDITCMLDRIDECLKT